MIVRVATAVISVCWGRRFYQEGRMAAAVFSAAVAVLFQPLLKVGMDRDIWMMADFILAVILLWQVGARVLGKQGASNGINLTKKDDGED